MIKFEKDPHAAFALVIDGKGLTYALEDDMKFQFLSLAVECASVICCRVSPKQKALVCIPLFSFPALPCITKDIGCSEKENNCFCLELVSKRRK